MSGPGGSAWRWIVPTFLALTLLYGLAWHRAALRAHWRTLLLMALSAIFLIIAVAGFGQLLRGGQYTGDFSYDNVLNLARSGRGEDPFCYRGEFIALVRLAKSLDKK